MSLIILNKTKFEYLRKKSPVHNKLVEDVQI